MNCNGLKMNDMKTNQYIKQFKAYAWLNEQMQPCNRKMYK